MGLPASIRRFFSPAPVTPSTGSAYRLPISQAVSPSFGHRMTMPERRRIGSPSETSRTAVTFDRHLVSQHTLSMVFISRRSLISAFASAETTSSTIQDSSLSSVGTSITNGSSACAEAGRSDPPGI